MKNTNKQDKEKGNSVKSYNQQGGITAYEVNDSTQFNIKSSKKSPGIPLWLKWVVAIIAILGFVAAIVFGILNISG